MTREEWLQAAAARLDILIQEAGFEAKPVRVSVGFPSKRGLSERRKVIGQCWPASCSADGVAQVFIHPSLTQPVDVLATLLHEQAHAATPGAGHAGAFVKLTRACGLEGKPTSDHPGEALTKALQDLAEQLGPYPQPAFNPGEGGVKKQSTRLLKALCGRCGYTIRVTAKWVEVGLPTCPCGGVIRAEQRDE